MKKGKRIKKNVNGETPLPEAMIQHIQSFMSGKEAARTTILSKSWYRAWLTRPTIDLDQRQFKRGDSALKKFATKTMQRYIDLSLKINSFRLYILWNYRLDGFDKLIVNAMKMGATDVQFDLPYDYTLPQEVVGSTTLVNLSLTNCCLGGNHVSCSSLKSLSLTDVRFRSDEQFMHIISCCNLLEELSLSSCRGLEISQSNLYEHLKLRRLLLYDMSGDNMFFTDFGSRFPCLKDLSIDGWSRGSNTIQIDSPSLQSINFVANGDKAKFDVPNIRNFTYECSGLSSKLSVTGALQEWKFDVSVHSKCFYKPSWFLNLKKMLIKFRLSRISLSLSVSTRLWRDGYEHEVGVQVVPEPLVVENLMIDVPSSHCCALLVRLFGICRPKFVTFYPLYPSHDAALDNLCKKLIMKKQPITPNGGIPHQDMFGPFGLKKVNVKVYEMFGTEWRPLPFKKPLDPSKTPVSKQKTEFELIWED